MICLPVLQEQGLHPIWRTETKLACGDVLASHLVLRVIRSVSTFPIRIYEKAGNSKKQIIIIKIKLILLSFFFSLDVLAEGKRPN